MSRKLRDDSGKETMRARNKQKRIADAIPPTADSLWKLTQTEPFVSSTIPQLVAMREHLIRTADEMDRLEAENAKLRETVATLRRTK